jgi:hypothetical protein
MARPIEPTPPLNGSDADRLLASLQTGAPESEMRRREEAAKRYLEAFDRGELIPLRASK